MICQLRVLLRREREVIFQRRHESHKVISVDDPLAVAKLKNPKAMTSEVKRAFAYGAGKIGAHAAACVRMRSASLTAPPVAAAIFTAKGSEGCLCP